MCSGLHRFQTYFYSINSCILCSNQCSLLKLFGVNFVNFKIGKTDAAFHDRTFWNQEFIFAYKIWLWSNIVNQKWPEGGCAISLDFETNSFSCFCLFSGLAVVKIKRRLENIMKFTYNYSGWINVGAVLKSSFRSAKSTWFSQGYLLMKKAV